MPPKFLSSGEKGAHTVTLSLGTQSSVLVVRERVLVDVLYVLAITAGKVLNRFLLGTVNGSSRMGNIERYWMRRDRAARNGRRSCRAVHRRVYAIRA
ncbi:MAG: hypothetical protein JWQ42_2345 [Edaphobacter sp.]|jgi:hypothetical protein|nr:hypothetical protein [Edaphobacter sp.]